MYYVGMFQKQAEFRIGQHAQIRKEESHRGQGLVNERGGSNLLVLFLLYRQQDMGRYIFMVEDLIFCPPKIHLFLLLKPLSRIHEQGY